MNLKMNVKLEVVIFHNFNLMSYILLQFNVNLKHLYIKL